MKLTEEIAAWPLLFAIVVLLGVEWVVRQFAALVLELQFACIRSLDWMCGKAGIVRHTDEIARNLRIMSPRMAQEIEEKIAKH